jgi:hypothetical protein
MSARTSLPVPSRRPCWTALDKVEPDALTSCPGWTAHQRRRERLWQLQREVTWPPSGRDVPWSGPGPGRNPSSRFASSITRGC